MRTKAITLITASLGIGAIAPMVACSDEKVNSSVAPAPATESPARSGPSSYGIKVLLGDEMEQAVIGPPGTVARSEGDDDGEEGPFPELDEESFQPSRPELMELTEIDAGGTRLDLDQVAADTDRDASPTITSMGSHLLAWAAAVECRAELAVAAPDKSISPIVERPWIDDVDSGYLDRAWYHFGTKGSSTPLPVAYPEGGVSTVAGTGFFSCDDVLAHQQVILCMAGKLAEVAEAVSPIVWTTPGDEELFVFTAEQPYHRTWTIPPQSTQDKFIARDLAINALAHVAALDFEWPNVAVAGDAPEGCYEAYDALLDDRGDGVLEDDLTQYVFGHPETTSYPRAEAITASSARGLVEARLKEKTQLLRASGLLLKKLVDDSVKADIEGAQVKRSHAGDPRLGSERAWGLEGGRVYNHPDNLYNNLAHAVNVLFGRLEVFDADAHSWHSDDPLTGRVHDWLWVDNSTHDPLLAPTVGCERYWERSEIAHTLNNGNVVGGTPFTAYAPGRNGRWTSRPATTAGQSYAVNLLASSGIFFPVTSSSIPVSDYRDATVEQLLTNAAIERGLANPYQDDILTGEPFRESNLGKAIIASVEQVSDADFQFALDRAAETFMYLTQVPFGGASDLLDNIYVDEEAGPGGLRLSEHMLSVVRDLGGVVIEGPVPYGDLHADLMSLAGAAQENSQCPLHQADLVSGRPSLEGRNRAFQSTFMLGDTLRTRLSLLAGLAEDQNLDDSVDRDARIAAAGIRQWAGEGRIFDGTKINGISDDVEIELTLQGFRPSDFGLSTLQELADTMVLVHGQPWVADCAAGIRQSCPEDFAADYVVKPFTLIQSSYDATAEDSSILLTAYEALLEYPEKFQPQFGSAVNNKRLYLVARTSAEDPARGKVLAAFHLNEEWEDVVGEVASDYRRDLFNKIAGISTTANEVGGDPVGTPLVDCGEVPQDYFVPLENELTSDSDSFESSWRHYLTLAELAAQKTDELGQELVAKGLERDYRREAAGEELGTICGDVGALGDFKLNELTGKLDPPDDNSELQTCFEESSRDIVFLTTDPFKGNTDDHTAILQEWLGCEEDDDSGLCRDAPPLTHASLNLADYVEPGAHAVNTECVGSAIALSQSVAAGNDISPASGRELAAYAPLRTANMAATLGSLAVNVSGAFNWNATLGGVPVMNTAASTEEDVPSLFPACVSAAGGCDELGTHLADLFGVTAAPANASERDALLLRITRALWLTATWTGRMPSGVINMPVPAANVNTILAGEQPAPAAITLFGRGSFVGSQMDGWTFDAIGDVASGIDVEIMGTGETPNQDHVLAISFFETTREPWQVSVYSNAQLHNNLIHFPASNTSVSYEGQELDDFLAVYTSQYRQDGCSYAPELPFSAGKPICVGPDGYGYLSTPTSMCDTATFADTPRNKGQKLYVPIAGNWGHGSMCASFDADCDHGYNSTLGYAFVSPACTTNEETGAGIRFTESAFLPSHCPPGDRVAAWSGAHDGASGCAIRQRIAEAMGLMCIFGSGMSGLPLNEPLPAISEPADLVRLKQWLFEQSHNSKRAVSQLMLRSVPDRVLGDVAGGNVGSGSIEGTVDDLVLQLGDDLRSIASGWVSLSGDFESLSHAIDDTQLALEGIDIATDVALKRLTMERIEQEARVAKSLVTAAAGAASLVASIATAGAGSSGGGGGVGFGNPFENAATTINASIDFGVALEQLNNLEELEDLTKDGKANEVARALSTLTGITIPLYASMHNTLAAIRTATSSALSTSGQLSLQRKQAEYVAAKGAGDDFYKAADGQVIELPVNIVLNNQYNLTKLRYENALKQAQRLAILARLAIEQRIGIRLSTIDTPVGALDPPSYWESDVCEFQGIDYGALLESGTFVPEQTTFASPFIGDYVEKLRNFMEYYNIEYPSHESDDLAVISVRDDLLGAGGRCYAQGTNLLTYSGALGTSLATAFEEQVVSEEEEAVAIPTELVGWQVNPCDAGDTTCLAVTPGDTLPVDEAGTLLSPPEEASYGAVSWLHDVPFQGAEDALDLSNPSGTVSQAVDLSSGTSYILSWWDMARLLAAQEKDAYENGFDPEAVAESEEISEYEVAIYDGEWNVIAADIIRPHAEVVAGALTWSERRVLQFAPANSGRHYVTLSASVAGSMGSVAIANVQLEEAIGTHEPTSYVHTEESLLQLTGNCMQNSPEQFRGQFAYQCDDTDDTCWWELMPNLVVNTEDVNSGNSRLEGKIARGNFNFRHITTAVNIVGTGVRECESVGTQDCYGSGYLEYTLEHDAFDVPVVAYSGDKAQTFDFGEARIERGKALATERYLTVPLGSADAELVGQSQTTKQEFRGRPLDGAYRLRIFDSPSLAWDRVEDVQLVVNYRYWSKIRREAEE